LLRFIRWNKWRYLNNFVYMTFLTNILVIKILNKYCPTVMHLNTISKSLFVCVICIFFGAICYYIQKFFFAKLKQILFDPQLSQSSQTVGIPEIERALAEPLKPHQSNPNDVL